jgi:hypothetical protein
MRFITPIREIFPIKIKIMSKNNYQKPSQQTQEEAMNIARGIQRPAQTKEQTRLIAQGIQKGIDLYKKQQNEKARDLSRKLKKVSRQKQQMIDSNAHEIQERIVYRQQWLPWLLLVLTWLGLGVYILVRN